VIIEPEIAGASIVLNGSFNPAIFSLDWFIRQRLVREADVQRSNENFFVSAQLTQLFFQWCQIVVSPDKFKIDTAIDPVIRIADLTIRTFSEFLPHTPILQMGINREVHFPAQGADVRDEVGYALAPPSVWGQWAEKITAKNDRTRGGLMSLTIVQRVFEGPRRGQVSVTVQPSNRIPNNCGIYMAVNDHYETASPNDGQSLISILKDRFEVSLRESDNIIDEIIRLAKAKEDAQASK
jgi:hypothetical protein